MSVGTGSRNGGQGSGQGLLAAAPVADSAQIAQGTLGSGKG